MQVTPYPKPDNWFQAGWNTACENIGLIVLPRGLNMFEAYDYLAGFTSAMWKQTLPNNWLT